MIIIKTQKYKLYTNKKNENLHQQIDISGIIWNHCISLHKKYYKLTGKFLNKYQLKKHITKLKKLPKYDFWKNVGSQAIQDIVFRIDKSYQLFFKNNKRNIKSSPPSYKKVKKYSSFTLTQSGWKLLGGNKIKIQGIIYKFSKSREVSETVKTLTIKRDKLGDLYLYFVVKEELDIPDMQGNVSVGFDFGLKTFFTLSDNTQYNSPLFMHQTRVELKKAQQELSRKVKFSNNWYKAKEKVTRIYKKIVNKRNDYFFKLAHTLTDKYDFLFFENLNMNGMKSLFGKKVSDLTRSSFMSILEYVAKTKGKIVHYIDRFFPSSKMCSYCGNINKELKLSDRKWTCKKCHVEHDRDFNAAVNIEREGASSLRLGNVRLSLTAIPV